MEELHQQVDRPVGRVDDQLVHLDDVRVPQLDDVLELRAQPGEQLLVARGHPFHRELAAGLALYAASDETEGAFTDDIGLFKAVRESLVGAGAAVEGVHLDVQGVSEEEEDVVLGLGAGRGEVW